MRMQGQRIWVGGIMMILLLSMVSVPALAQDRDENVSAEPDTLEAGQSSTGEPDDENPYGDQPRENKPQTFGKKDDSGFVTEFKNNPKAGIRSNATTNVFYGDFSSNLTMTRASKWSNQVGYSWTDFRQQIKTTEKRNASSTYNTGTLFPFMGTLQGSWNWNEDRTTNAGGYNNTSKQDFRTGGLSLNKPRLKVGAFNLIMKASAGANNQKSINQNQRNDVAESYLDGGFQMGTRVVDGVMVAGRVFGRTTGGSRNLGEETAPSSATSDSVGFGVYYDRNHSNGRVTMTRGNFDRQYLDYVRNTNGLIDTVGVDEDKKIVDDSEIKDVLTLGFVNQTHFWGLFFETNLAHSMNESDYAINKVGYKERLQQQADFSLGFSVGRDSFSVSYGYLWKWDDQLNKEATIKRGRSYNKERDLNLYWGRPLFKKTNFTLNFHTGLGQDTAENAYVNTDKDRYRNDLAVRLERNWPERFRVSMLFSFKQNQDLALQSTRSANNNTKDSYEIAPGYSWPLSDWLTFSQNYRVYIQYTDFHYSYLEGSNKSDNYNKRGNLSTIVKLIPTSRLELTVKHDYNKRFNADKSNEGSAGGTQYSVYQRQNIGKIDLSFVFKVANGVVLEGATYRTRDEKTSISTVDKVSERYEGRIWIGAKVNKRWGTKRPLELSAMVKKYNAYGPSISEASSDYWESDVWLKWEF